jgi:hypothetical protein
MRWNLSGRFVEGDQSIKPSRLQQQTNAGFFEVQIPGPSPNCRAVPPSSGQEGVQESTGLETFLLHTDS